MTDIWDEKPIRPSSESILMFERRRYSWEHQLKIEYDKLKAKAEKWDDLKEFDEPIIKMLYARLESVKNFWDYLLTTAFKDTTVDAIWSEKRGMAVDISLWLHDELEEWNKQHSVKILEKILND